MPDIGEITDRPGRVLGHTTPDASSSTIDSVYARDGDSASFAVLAVATGAGAAGAVLAGCTYTAPASTIADVDVQCMRADANAGAIVVRIRFTKSGGSSVAFTSDSLAATPANGAAVAYAKTPYTKRLGPGDTIDVFLSAGLASSSLNVDFNVKQKSIF